ncbi:mechanosensitive ion channel [Lysobacter sp. LF1]|uniref:Mechanosensitive ion channel n=1 Tax=Lysobacter stagni TaxID=3045172 RepID=A0ABT6XIS7_9GAMM|nr:mechanosensitive ion channel domain-containing protein [Lysobacter sp. LF1]MDI9239974.1 mechanosensitive ion channel [Lysobacter sp. LF1]
MLHRFGWLVCLVALALAPVSGLRAQTATPEGTDADPPRKPTAIAVADIPYRADTDERFAEGVSLRVASPDPIAQLSPQLEAIAKSVDQKLREIKTDEMRSLPVMRLESLERHWKFDARRFARWQTDMRQAVAPYTHEAAELAQRRADWEATQAAARAGNMPVALVTRVDTLVDELRKAEQELSGPLARQIDLGRRANAVDARIQAGLRAVAAAIDYIDSRLVRLDAPPLWRARPTTGDDKGALASIATGLEIETRFAREYAAAGTGNQHALHVFQVSLLPLLIWLAIRSRRFPETSDADEASMRVLRRPVSSWLLLSMMAVLAFEPDAPLLVHQVAMLIALVPVLRLIPPNARLLLGPWPYVAAGLYLLERVAFLFIANAFLYRIYYLGLGTLALLLTLWLLWRSRHVSHSGLVGRVGKAVHIAAWVSVALLAISVGSNVFGNVSLAEMLVSGVIDSGYLALVLYASVTVFVALVRLLLARHGVPRFRLSREHAPPLALLVIRLIVLAATIGWLVFTTNRFRIFRPIYAFTSSVLSYTFRLGEITISLGHVLIFAVSVLIAFWAAKSVRYLLQEEVLTRMSLPRGVANSVASLTYYALLLLGVVVALSAAGFQMSQLAFVFGALGVGIGFGLQNVVNNFVSGLILMFERPIQPGDVVEITGTSGRVRDIGMRATTIKTFEGADVVVPNGTLLSEKLTNWTLLDRNRRIDVEVGVAYGSDPARIADLLRAATLSTPGVVRDPAPAVLFTAMGASSLTFAIRAWTNDYDNSVSIRSELVTRMYRALTEAGIEIPFPQQDMHLRSLSGDIAAMFAAQAPPHKPAGDGA